MITFSFVHFFLDLASVQPLPDQQKRAKNNPPISSIKAWTKKKIWLQFPPNMELSLPFLYSVIHSPPVGLGWVAYLSKFLSLASIVLDLPSWNQKANKKNVFYVRFTWNFLSVSLMDHVLVVNLLLLLLFVLFAFQQDMPLVRDTFGEDEHR